MERVVMAGLKNSDSMKYARDNLKKKQIYFNSKKFPNNITLSLSNNSEIFFKNGDNNKTITADLDIPFTDEISVIFGYTLTCGSSPKIEDTLYREDKSNGSFLFGMSINPLEGIKEISEYKKALDSLNIEQLKQEYSRIGIELEIRSSYITALESIGARKLAEYVLENTKKEYKHTKERFDLGLVSRNSLDSSLLRKLEAEEGLDKKRRNEFAALLSLSRLINVDVSKKSLKSLGSFPYRDLDEKKIISTIVSSNILLKIANNKLSRLKKNLKTAEYAFLPEINIIPGIVVQDKNSDKWAPGLSINMSFDLSFSQGYDIKKTKIDILQQERVIRDIRRSIEDTEKIIVWSFKARQKKVKQLKLLLKYKKNIFLEKQVKYKEGEILSTELEKARISILKAENDLKKTWDSIWMAWYDLQAISMGYSQNTAISGYILK